MRKMQNIFLPSLASHLRLGFDVATERGTKYNIRSILPTGNSSHPSHRVKFYVPVT